MRSLSLWAVAADTRELRTVPYDAALPVLFAREQTRTEGFEPWCGHKYYFSSVLFINFFFYASRHAAKDLRLRRLSYNLKTMVHFTLMSQDTKKMEVTLLESNDNIAVVLEK